MSDITTSQKEPNPVFIQIAKECIPLVLKNVGSHEVTVSILAPKLEKDFEALYDIWVREDDDYIHKDMVYEYVCENPPERGM